MAARNKSKKTTKSKTKKTRPASSAKPASKRISKEASSSSVRSRARQEQAGVEREDRVENHSSKDEEYRSETFEAKAEEPRRRNCSRARGAAKKLAKAASARKPAASKSLSKGAKSATPSKQLWRGRERKRRKRSWRWRVEALEARPAPDKNRDRCRRAEVLARAFTPLPNSSEPASLVAKLATPPAKGQKAGGPEEAVAKSVRPAGQRQGFKLNEFVVYPAHGVGQIVAIEEQEVAGFRLELFVISFSKDKLTLARSDLQGFRGRDAEDIRSRHREALA